MLSATLKKHYEPCQGVFKMADITEGPPSIIPCYPILFFTARLHKEKFK